MFKEPFFIAFIKIREKQVISDINFKYPARDILNELFIQLIINRDFSFR